MGAPFLIIGTYNKLVKHHGSDQADQADRSDYTDSNAIHSAAS
jgi:hypothetical protein